MQQDWPFADPPNVITITLQQIMDGDKPIQLVVHDSDDGAWQFLDGDTFSMDNALLIAFEECCRC